MADIKIQRIPLRPNSTEPKMSGLEYCQPSGMEQTGNSILVRRMPAGSAPCVVFDRVPFPIAEWRADKYIGIAPLAVAFTNESLYAESYEWHFGDGATSDEESPIHEYARGSYTVSLHARNLAGEDVRSGGISATPPGCPYDDYTQSTYHSVDSDAPTTTHDVMAEITGGFTASASVRCGINDPSFWGEYWFAGAGCYVRDGVYEYRLFWWGYNYWDEGAEATRYFLQPLLTGPSSWTQIAAGPAFEVADSQAWFGSETPPAVKFVRSGGNVAAHYDPGNSGWVLLGNFPVSEETAETGVIVSGYGRDNTYAHVVWRCELA